MTYFIIAGEASGDLHGSNLIKAIRQRDNEAVFVGLGGDKMKEAGCNLIQHISKMAYMGVIAVVSNLNSIRGNFKLTQQALLLHRPDVLVLIDYPSFNLRIAHYAKQHLPLTHIAYYIPPKIWAWKTRRVHRIAKLSDVVLGIFPFEPDFYARFGYQCTYIGNPVSENIRLWQQANAAIQDPNEQDIIKIALLPGSRRNEINRCLDKMMRAATEVKKQLEKERKKTNIYIAAAPGIEQQLYSRYENDATITNDTYKLVSQATAAVVNSGTATLETALLGCPQTAVYHVTGSKYLWWLKPLIFKIPFFTLVNIIAGKEVIRELIAQHFTQMEIQQELLRLISDNCYREQMKDNYRLISSLLGETDTADTAAKHIVQLAKIKTI